MLKITMTWLSKKKKNLKTNFNRYFRTRNRRADS